MIVWWRELAEVENECTSHNYSLFAIFLPKIIKIGGNLMEVVIKTILHGFFRQGVDAYINFISLICSPHNAKTTIGRYRLSAKWLIIDRSRLLTNYWCISIFLTIYHIKSLNSKCCSFIIKWLKPMSATKAQGTGAWMNDINLTSCYIAVNLYLWIAIAVLCCHSYI